MIESGNKRVFPETLSTRIAGGILLGGESRIGLEVDLQYYALVDHRLQCLRRKGASLALPHFE